MANHKRRRAKNRRAGCLLCKPWKANGFGPNRPDAERFADHRRRRAAASDLAAYRGAARGGGAISAAANPSPG